MFLMLRERNVNNKITFSMRINFQDRYFNVEGRKITELEIAPFSKRRKRVYVLEDSRLLEVKFY